MKKLTFLFYGVLLSVNAFSWGFYAHREINRLAVFSMDPGVFGFFKTHIDYLMQHSTDPDMRRYAVAEEACRHYIDLDRYEKSLPIDTIPKYWKKATDLYGEDSLSAHGIVPWYIVFMEKRLEKAFENKDTKAILKTAADLGHYIADASVPLHTTSNYNGQLSGQKGIHALWESRIPEQRGESFELLAGRAIYIKNLQEEIWVLVTESHACLDSVFNMERLAEQQLGEARKYAMVTKGNSMLKSYSPAFVDRYHFLLGNQVERRMERAIRMVASVWYTAWINAGQPVLDGVPNKLSMPEDSIPVAGEKMLGREEE